MGVIREIPIETDNLEIDIAEIDYDDDTEQVSISLVRDYSGSIWDAPGFEVVAGGDVIARANSIAFVTGLSPTRSALLEHGSPVVLRVDGAGSVDLTQTVMEAIPEFAGPKVQVSSLFSTTTAGVRTLVPGEDAEITVGVTNYGDQTGRRRVTVELGGTQVGSLTFEVEPDESQRDSFTISVPAGLPDPEVELAAGGATVPLTVTNG